MLHAFHALIVQIASRNFQIIGQRIGLNTPAVIFRRNEYATRCIFANGLICTAMAEFKTENLRPEREPQDFVTETYTKNRFLPTSCRVVSIA